MHETLGFPRFPILSKQNFPRRRDLICIMASKATFLCSRAAPKRSFSSKTFGLPSLKQMTRKAHGYIGVLPSVTSIEVARVKLLSNAFSSARRAALSR